MRLLPKSKWAIQSFHFRADLIWPVSPFNGLHFWNLSVKFFPVNFFFKKVNSMFFRMGVLKIVYRIYRLIDWLLKMDFKKHIFSQLM